MKRRRRRYKIKHSYIKKSRGRSRSRSYTRNLKRNKKRKKKRKTVNYPFNRFERKINTVSRPTPPPINFPETPTIFNRPTPMNFPKTRAERAPKKEDEDGWASDWSDEPFDDTPQRNQQQFTPWPDISNKSSLEKVASYLRAALPNRTSPPKFISWPDISNESQDTLKNVGNILKERLKDDPTPVKEDGWASDWSD